MNTRDWEVSGKYFPYEGYQIFYKKMGAGTPLLLLHGFPTSSWDWHKIINKLATKHEVICLDMIGYGFSDKPLNNSYSIFQQADIVSALLAHLTIGTTHILAHDKGDTVANELLARQNEGHLSFKIQSCCLLNGGLFPGIHKPRPVQWALMTPIGKYIAKLYSFGMFKRTFSRIFGPQSQASESELIELWDLMNYKNGMKVFHLLIYYMQDRIDHEARWLKALQETNTPLRLINGAQDPISGIHMAKHYQKVIPHPDVVLLEDIGHYPQLEAPEELLLHFFTFQKGLNQFKEKRFPGKE